MKELKLYQLLLGSKAQGRHIEQHDFFFGIAGSVKELVPELRRFWPEGQANLHVDGWREVTNVNGFQVKVVASKESEPIYGHKLFFINLGGYLPGVLEEQHYAILTVQPDKDAAIREAKRAVFFKGNSIPGVKGANAHIDDKYGIDVDDIYQIEDMLLPAHRAEYDLQITPGYNLPEDKVHLGYFRLDKLV